MTLDTIAERHDKTECSYFEDCPQRKKKACTFKEMLSCGHAIAKCKKGRCLCCGAKDEELFMVSTEPGMCAKCCKAFALPRLVMASGSTL